MYKVPGPLLLSDIWHFQISASISVDLVALGLFLPLLNQDKTFISLPPIITRLVPSHMFVRPFPPVVGIYLIEVEYAEGGRK